MQRFPTAALVALLSVSAPAIDWSIVITTAPGLPQDVWMTGHGNNTDGWQSGGNICLGHLAQGFEVGQHVTVRTRIVEAGVVGEDGTPVPPGDYIAPSGELGNREFQVVSGQTFYVIFDGTIINSNIKGFERGQTFRSMFTFDALMGNHNQFVVLWFASPSGGFAPALNEGVMKTILRSR